MTRQTFPRGPSLLWLHFHDVFFGSTFERSIENPYDAVRNAAVGLFIGKSVPVIAYSALSSLIRWMRPRLNLVRARIDRFLVGAYLYEIESLYRYAVLARCLSRFSEDTWEADRAYRNWRAARGACVDASHLRKDEKAFARELIENGGIPPEIVIYLFAIGAIRMDETGRVLLGCPKIDWILRILAILGISMGAAYIGLLYVVASVEHVTRIQHELLLLLVPMAFVAYLLDLVLFRPLQELNRWDRTIRSVAGPRG